MDRWRGEGEGLEVVLLGVDRRGGDKAVLAVRSWVEWVHRWDLPSSSWTAGSGSLLQTCRSSWWT